MMNFGSARNRFRSDEGAIVAIFAVLLGTGALLGMLALSFDIGLVYLERRTVQVGADSAAEAVAQKCALHADQCDDQSAALALAASLVNANAEDGATSIEEVCGVPPLASCTTLTERYADCEAPALSGGRIIPTDLAFARVTTRTESNGGTVVRTPFSDLLDGQGGNSGGVSLWSCAQAVWGKVDHTDVKIPLMFGACEYQLSEEPVVVAAFPPDPRPAARPVPIRRDCTIDTYSTSGQVVDTTFSQVANGFAPIVWPDSTCNSYQRIDAGQDLDLRSGDLRSLCGSTIGAFAAYLDQIIAQDAVTPGGLYERLPVGGVVTQGAPPNNDQVSFETRSFFSFRLLGYSLVAPPGSGNRATYEGGALPPGGWSAYPAGATRAESCAVRSCLYGQFGTFTQVRDRLSVDPAIPNMGVQAVESIS